MTGKHVVRDVQCLRCGVSSLFFLLLVIFTENHYIVLFVIISQPLWIPFQHTLGWMYEYAHNEDQRYKEQRVILEVKLCREQDGFCDVETGFQGPYPLVDNEHGGSPVYVCPSLSKFSPFSVRQSAMSQ